jgi:hypothetical protein
VRRDDPAGSPAAAEGTLGSGAVPLPTTGSALSALTAGISGVAPHVLHHVGPLAGAAFLSGVGGTVLFGLVGFAVSVPMLLRIRRRFGTWLAPGIASAVFVAVYLVSALVIGPALTRGAPIDGGPETSPVPTDHEEHHGIDDERRSV